MQGPTDAVLRGGGVEARVEFSEVQSIRVGSGVRGPAGGWAVIEPDGLFHVHRGEDRGKNELVTRKYTTKPIGIIKYDRL